MAMENSPPKTAFFRSKTGLALIGFLGIAAFFIFTEHRAHLLGVLPYLLLLLCPLMHLLGHRGHGRHKGCGPGEEGNTHGREGGAP